MMTVFGFYTVMVVACQSLEAPAFKKYKPKAISYALIDVSEIEPGRMKTVILRGFPVRIYRRTQSEILKLNRQQFLVYDQLSQKQDESQPTEEWQKALHQWKVSDVDWLNPNLRSHHEAYFVFFALSPISGCSIINGSAEDYDAQKQIKTTVNIFYDPCTNLGYDNAGRVFYNGIDAKQHLFVPPYQFTATGKLEINLAE